MSILSSLWLLPSFPPKYPETHREEPSEVEAESIMGIQESSSGFHIIEIHAPTVGFGIFSIIGFLVVIFLLWNIYKCLRARMVGPVGAPGLPMTHYPIRGPVAPQLPMIMVDPRMVDHRFLRQPRRVTNLADSSAQTIEETNWFGGQE